MIKFLLVASLLVGPAAVRCDIPVRDILTTTKQVTDAVGSVGDFLKDNVGKFGKAVGKIAGAMGPLGGLIEFVTSFFPSGPSEELVAIQKGFEEMKNMIQDVSNQMNNVKDQILLAIAAQDYQNTYDKVRNMWREYMEFADFPSNATTIELQKACVTYDPTEALNTIYDRVMGNNPGTKLLTAIVNGTNASLENYLLWSKIILGDTARALLLTQPCNVLKPNTPAALVERRKKDNLDKTAQIENKLKDVAADTFIKDANRFRNNLLAQLSDRHKQQAFTLRYEIMGVLKNYLDKSYTFAVFNVHYLKAQNAILTTAYSTKLNVLPTLDLGFSWTYGEERNADELLRMSSYMSSFTSPGNECDRAAYLPMVEKQIKMSGYSQYSAIVIDESDQIKDPDGNAVINRIKQYAPRTAMKNLGVICSGTRVIVVIGY